MFRDLLRPALRHTTVVFTTLVSGALLLAACTSEPGLPEPGSDDYREAVSAFYTAIAAMQVGEDARAEAKLEWLTTAVPAEPAGWANLALYYLRRGAIDEADAALTRARTLAPDAPRLLLLSGRLESARENPAAALDYYRRAAEAGPDDPVVLYALAVASPDPAEATAALDRLLDGSPDNLPVRLERLRRAVEAGEWTATDPLVAALDAEADPWPDAADAPLEALAEAVDARDAEAATTQLGFLRNVLLRTPAFRSGLAAVQPPLELVAAPLTTFLRLPAPDSHPAPPDDSLTFTVQPLAVPNGPWRTLRTAALTGDGWPALLLAGDTRLRIDHSFTGLDGQAPTAPNVDLSFPGVAGTSPGPHALAPLDFDYDFRVDLAAAGAAGVRLFRQDSTGRFTDVTPRLGLPAGLRNAAYLGVWTADLDLEGDLDLILGPADGATVVLRNNGDGTFTPVDFFGDLPAVRDFAWADLDADGDPDAAALDANGRLHVLRNERSAAFTRLAPTDGPFLALTLADLDRDATFDLLALREDGAILHHAFDPDATVPPPLATTTVQATQPGAARLQAADLDNNGASDLVISSETGSQVLLGVGDGTFLAAPGSIDAFVTDIAELTADGRLDLAALDADGRPAWHANQSSAPYHWVEIRPRSAQARGDQRINSFGVGGEIEVRAGTLYRKTTIDGPIVHVGLGEQVVADVVRIIWPNGDVQAEFDVLTGQAALAQQRLKGSCPWLFTYDGKGMTFVTDFLWRSPLGLRINAQETAGIMATEDWVRIRGDQLVPRDGVYDVRITAELWETHFFDHASLLVVDHPDDTEILVDERFAFPPPPLAVHAVDPLRSVARVTTDTGLDVSADVASLDRRYLDFFGRGAYQGVTRSHSIVVDLPVPAVTEDTLWLVGSGWIRPTDSSINVALAQGDGAPPQGLRLEVPDGAGGWRTLHPNLGFPSGKLKTIVMDLTNAFPPGVPRRVRLTTNLEIYWDRLAWTVPRPDAELHIQPLTPATAELRYRGFSHVAAADRSSPELPTYAPLAAAHPVWRDLEGYYTRFGPVEPLLESVDDRYVIMNAGDELAFTFDAPPEPPDGLVRDFVLVGDGWVKDGDYNTTFSETVRPLPSHDAPDYTTPPTTLEDDPVYRRHAADWQKYHTRYVAPDHFHHALRLP